MIGIPVKREREWGGLNMQYNRQTMRSQLTVECKQQSSSKFLHCVMINFLMFLRNILP